MKKVIKMSRSHLTGLQFSLTLCPPVIEQELIGTRMLRDVVNYRMIAAFGSGASYSLVSGITQGNKFQGAFTTGVLFAAFQGALHKVSHNSSQLCNWRNRLKCDSGGTCRVS